MNERFNPAPYDKHAVDPREAADADRQTHENLKSGLIDSFPASDPISAVQPAKTRHDETEPPSLWDKIVSVFR
jgi:hypothetical protein